MRLRCLILAFSLWLSSQPAIAADAPLLLATLDYPPYIVNGERGAQGLLVDIVGDAFARIGQPIRIEFYPVARRQYRLLHGQADGFFSIKKTAERERTMLFPKTALMHQDYVFFVRRDARWRFTGNFASLADTRIGVVSATSYGARFDDARQNGSFRTLDQAADHEANFRKLLARRVDVVIASRLVGQHYLAKLGALDDVAVSGPVVETTQSYLVFTRHKDYTALAAQFDRALDSMQRDGTLERLNNAYLRLPQAGAPERSPAAQIR